MSEKITNGEDRISILPDHLLCQILLYLSTKHAVRTSALSQRWKRIWLLVPACDAKSFDFPDCKVFVSFLDGFLNVSRNQSSIHKLELVFDSNPLYPSSLTRWIHSVVTRKVQHLDIFVWRKYFEEETTMPLCLYTCETLVYLNLKFVSLPGFEYDMSLPRLKTMILRNNMYFSDTLLEKLISSCTVLQDLTVVRYNVLENTVKDLRERSQSLKNLTLFVAGNSEDTTGDWKVVIDAPRLRFLSLKDSYSTSFSISNLSSSVKVDIDVSFAGSASSKTSLVRKFFTGLSSVRDMTLGETTFKILCNYINHEPVPKFTYLNRFHVNTSYSDLETFLKFLECCPSLRSLVLELKEYKKNEKITLTTSSVPECLRSSLKYVEVKSPMRGASEEMKLVQYFLENSAVLKKFALSVVCRNMDEESIIFSELLRLKRCSASCELVVKPY